MHKLMKAGLLIIGLGLSGVSAQTAIAQTATENASEPDEQALNFEVKSLGVDEELVMVRFMPENGLTWVLEDMSWVGVEEAEGSDLFLGNYDVQMIETEDVVWYVRYDKLTGRTWVLGQEDENPVWVYADDPELDAEISDSTDE